MTSQVIKLTVGKLRPHLYDSLHLRIWRSKCLAGLTISRNFSRSGGLGIQKLMEVGGGQTVNYEQVGNGSKVLLCLPGALGFIESDFSPQLKQLQDEFTLVAWDPPGYGRSRPPDRDFTGSAGNLFFHRDAKAAQELMQNLGHSKFSILGWSDGGITGMILTSMFPDSVEKLVIWGANAYVDKSDIDAYVQIRNIDTWSPKMAAPLLQIYGEIYFRKLWEDWVDTFLDIFKNGGDLCKNDLEKIICPTLIIHGLKDAMVGMEHAEYIHKNIKNSKLHVMPEGKHNLHLRYPDEFNALVRKFLNEDNCHFLGH